MGVCKFGDGRSSGGTGWREFRCVRTDAPPEIPDDGSGRNADPSRTCSLRRDVLGNPLPVVSTIRFGETGREATGRRRSTTRKAFERLPILGDA